MESNCGGTATFWFSWINDELQVGLGDEYDTGTIIVGGSQTESFIITALTLEVLDSATTNFDPITRK